MQRNRSAKRIAQQTKAALAKINRRVKTLLIRHPTLRRYFLSPDGRMTAVYTKKRRGADSPEYWWTTYARNGRIEGGSTEGYHDLGKCLKNYNKPQPTHVFGCIDGTV